jgi:D-glycero-D-manno-heptose 1,7-bisphosphate phosphatase
MSARAIFLDRDGVINRNREDYVKHWHEFVFLPNVFAALRYLAATDYWVVVITNQSAVGRGLMSRAALDALHARMLGEIRRNGGRIDAVLYCPHRPEESCACRKPRPGLLHEAARLFDLDLRASCMVGDNESDVYAALATGVRPLLVSGGHGHLAERRLRAAGMHDYTRVPDLLGAVDSILGQEQSAARRARGGVHTRVRPALG